MPFSMGASSNDRLETPCASLAADRLRLVQGGKRAVQPDGLLHEWPSAGFCFFRPLLAARADDDRRIQQHLLPSIGNDIAAIVLNLPYESFRPSDHPLTDTELKASNGVFKFGPDSYQPNAQVRLIAEERQLAMRWPSGDISPLISLERGRFIDRSYWQDVKIERDALSLPTRLIYDHFEGKPVTASSDH
jgi:hypothetical protein